MRRFGSSAEVLVFLLAASPNAALGQTAKPTVTAVTNVAPAYPEETVELWRALLHMHEVQPLCSRRDSVYRC